ncbi:MAG: hypothetical protein J6Y89_03595 [Lachnospiraceae bacterium]|nr:hypothetical protein [Lachnospiraceae bacterium]
MDALMFEEMRKNADIISKYVKEKGAESEEIKKKRDFIKEAKKTALEILDIARKQGFLELKRLADKLQPDGIEGHLKDMLYFVADGMDTAVLEEIARNKYFTNCYSGFGGLEFIIYMYTCMTIRQNVPLQVIEAVIDSMIPDVVRLEVNVNNTEGCL